MSIRDHKKGQIWYADFTVALMLFLIATAIYFQYTNNLSSQDELMMHEMVLDLKAISSSVIHEGYPKNWTEDNVKSIGITDGNYRIDQTKLERFAEMNHSSIINNFNTPYNFYMYLEDQEGNVLPVSGQNGIGKDSSSSLNRVQIIRLGVYNSSIVRMVMHLWQ